MEISEEELNKKIKEAVEKATGDLRGEKESLLSKNSELLNEKKAISEKLKAFDGMDPTEFEKLKKNLSGSEEARLLAEGKLDEVVNRRSEKIRVDLEGKLVESQKKLEAEQAKAIELTNKMHRREVDLAISQAATEAGVSPTAIPDIIKRASDVFSVDEDGSIVARDKNKQIIKVGNEAMNPKNYIQGLKKEAPHFWPGNVSGDLKGSARDQTLIDASKAGDMASFRAARQAETK